MLHDKHILRIVAMLETLSNKQIAERVRCPVKTIEKIRAGLSRSDLTGIRPGHGIPCPVQKAKRKARQAEEDAKQARREIKRAVRGVKPDPEPRKELDSSPTPDICSKELREIRLDQRKRVQLIANSMTGMSIGCLAAKYEISERHARIFLRSRIPPDPKAPAVAGAACLPTRNTYKRNIA